MLPPQLVRFCEIVRGVHVEEEEPGIGHRLHLFQRQDTDSDPVVEADGAEVTRCQARGDGFFAARTVGGAQGLYSSAPPAFRQHCVVLLESSRERADQRYRDEWHVPGNANNRSRRFDHSGVDAAERAQAGFGIGYDSKIGTPGRRVRSIGNEERRLAQCGRHDANEPVQDSFTAHTFQTLRLPAKPCGTAAGQNSAPNTTGPSRVVYPGYLLTRRRVNTVALFYAPG